MDNWVPLHLRDLVLATDDFEIRHDVTFVIHEDDAWHVRGHSEHHIDLAGAPGRQEAFLVILHSNEVVKEHCHLCCCRFLSNTKAMLALLVSLVSLLRLIGPNLKLFKLQSILINTTNTNILTYPF